MTMKTGKTKNPSAIASLINATLTIAFILLVAALVFHDTLAYVECFG